MQATVLCHEHPCHHEAYGTARSFSSACVAQLGRVHTNEGAARGLFESQVIGDHLHLFCFIFCSWGPQEPGQNDSLRLVLRIFLSSLCLFIPEWHTNYCVSEFYTMAPDPHAVNAQEATANGHNDDDKPSTEPTAASKAKEQEKSKNGAGAKLKAFWASLGIDVPTFLMMLK
jgi:hypothetical protein